MVRSPSGQRILTAGVAITREEIEEIARMHPDLKRPVPGEGFFGHMGYVMVGSVPLDHDNHSVLVDDISRPSHMLLLMKRIKRGLM